MRLATLVLVGILSANAIGQNPIKLTEAALTSQQRSQIAHAIDSGAYAGCLNENGASCERSAEFIRLSPNTTQIVVTLFLGGAGNQAIWVFNLVDDHSVLLLSGEGSGFGPLAALHNGMHEFEISGPCGGGHCVNRVYRFDGKHYEVTYCIDTNLGEDGKWRSGPRHPCK
jgi:hypothetical protein